MRTILKNVLPPFAFILNHPQVTDSVLKLVKWLQSKLCVFERDMRVCVCVELEMDKRVVLEANLTNE